MCSCGKFDGPCSVHAQQTEDALMETLAERDRLADLLDTFAYTIAPQLAIGEHSSMNDPWQNALDMLVPTAQHVAVLDCLRRCLDSLEVFVAEDPDPGVEAFGAMCEAKILLAPHARATR